MPDVGDGCSGTLTINYNNRLGSGNFGDVFKGQIACSRQIPAAVSEIPVAVKMFKQNLMLEDFLKEYEVIRYIIYVYCVVAGFFY